MKLFYLALVILILSQEKSGAGHFLQKYHWYDENGEQVVYLEKNLLILYGEDNKIMSKAKKSLSSAPGMKIIQVSSHEYEKIVLQQSQSVRGRQQSDLDDLSPIFTARPGSGSWMGLPGGVIVYFRQILKENEVKNWAHKKNLKVKDSLNLLGKNAWVLEGSPGLSSLLLANSLRNLPEVKAAMPNWWRSFQLK
jgi:hypothetical protein